MRNPPLQGRSLWHIIYMLLFDGVVLWAMFSWRYLDTIVTGEEHPTEPMVNAVLAVIAVLVALVLTLRIRPEWKDTIVFWHRQNGFSSSRAFSVLAQKDYRFRVEALRQRTGPFPEDAAGQQALWDRLYDKYADVPVIRRMRGQYLLCYEIAAVSLLLVAPMLALVAASWSSPAIILASPGFLIGQYIMFVVATRFMGDDLVKGVLALEAMG